MSELHRQSMNGAPTPPRRRPDPVAILEADDTSSSDSSASSASSVATVETIRPSSREHEAPPNHWSNYFSQDLYLEDQSEDASVTSRFHVYVTPPTDLKKGPLFICHHGAGASGLSFACFARDVRAKLPDAGVLSLEARGHGSIVISASGEEVVDYSLAALVSDGLKMIELVRAHFSWPKLPPTVLIGHSLGGAVMTTIATQTHFSGSLIGFCVLDVVEGSAMEALSHMRTYLSSRPSMFKTLDQAIQWHIRNRTIRDKESAEVSVPSLLVQTSSGSWRWRTDLSATSPWWSDWFEGLSAKFLSGKGAKLLILAGTDRLDKELMIGQMQGKFQLTVLPEAGHFVQEDVPDKTAQLLVDFFRRNDRSALVLPPKVSDLIAQGKKV